MLTKNEKKVLRIVMTDLDSSINQIARQAEVTAQGAFKILRKFEKEGILKEKKISNISTFQLIFNNKTHAVLRLALIDELGKRLQYRHEDLKELKDVTKTCIIFGSYLYKKSPNDLDLFFIVEKPNYKEYKKRLKEVIAPLEIHDVVQTEEDIEANLKKKDKVLIEILRKGVVLWGEEAIVRAVENVKA
jgi:DNA-binding Lrp family transcriptional regulator